MQRILVSLCLLALLVFSIFLVTIGLYWKSFLEQPINQTSEPFRLKVKAGDSITKIAYQLKREGRTSHPKLLIFLTQIKGVTQDIKIGHYSILPNTTPNELIDKMVAGDVILEKLTILDGWTFKKLMEQIHKNPHIKHTLQGMPSKEIMKKLNSPHPSPEGLFFPDTYLFTENTTDFELLKQAFDRMQDTIKKQWANRENDLLYKKPYEALIVASLIQKETALPEEYTKVASVILNRLKKGMALQIDPTVIYGLGDKFKGFLTRKQLKIDSPYNTYTRQGLPPTPIAFVNPKTLYAALHPAKGGLLYFVATGDGGHIFSTNLNDHLDAVKQYRKKQKEDALEEKTANQDQKK